MGDVLPAIARVRSQPECNLCVYRDDLALLLHVIQYWCTFDNSYQLFVKILDLLSPGGLVQAARPQTMVDIIAQVT